MKQPNFWVIFRAAILVLSVLIFGQAAHADTNFGFPAGLICGFFCVLICTFHSERKFK